MYDHGQLCVEGVPVTALAREHGTPLYVYSRGHLRRQYETLSAAMAQVSPLLCYSVKANSNAAVLGTFLACGSGLDVVSGGELFRGLRAGADPRQIVFAGVGKTRDEIRYALDNEILFFTVESEAEAVRISECAGERGRVGRIAFRVNPDVDPRTHRYTSTGKKENKFGLDIERAERACAAAADLPGLEIVGIHMHIGSQILDAQPFVDALQKVRPLCAQLASRYGTLRYLDIGGGIGIRYEPGQEPLTPETFAAAVVPLLKDIGLSVIMEPGRYLVGNAGLLVCRVQYLKENPVQPFLIVDAGMNDLIRPALYQAYQEVIPVDQTDGVLHGNLVGPICESGDFIALDRDLPAVSEGDLLAVRGAGAYGFAMASNYNSRPRPAEIMVEGNQATVIRDRETWEDLVRGENPC